MFNLNSLLTSTLLLAASSHAALYTLSTPSSPSNPSLSNLKINAQGRAFYAGLQSPATYCPEVVGPSCPKNPDSSTMFVNLMGLNVMVPGGQAIFVTPEGVMGFTGAHSAFIPAGSYRSGWVSSPSPSDPGRQSISWETPGGSSVRGILACPATEASASQRATYQIYARTPGFNRTDCVGLEGLVTMSVPDGTPTAVWQYI